MRIVLVSINQLLKDGKIHFWVNYSFKKKALQKMCIQRKILHSILSFWHQPLLRKSRKTQICKYRIAAQMTWWEMFEFRRKLSPCTPVYRNKWDISHVIFLRPLVFKIHHARSAGLTSTSRWAVHYKEHASVQYIRNSSNETYLLS